MKKSSFRTWMKTLSLKTRLTLTVGLILLSSILLSLGIVTLLNRIFPSLLQNVPQLLQLNILIFSITVIATRVFAKIFFDPILALQEGMRKVAEGDFKVQLNTKTSSPELREVVEGFNLMTRELDATEILKSDFISNVSHEFKTPITAIEGYVTLLQDENLSSQQGEYTEKILFNTRRLSTLMGNILLLSRIENSPIREGRTRFRLDEQIRQALLLLEPVWSEKELEFDVDLEELHLEGTEHLLHHVWSNLIGNAVKFSPYGGTVTIRLKKAEDRVIFAVEDQGPGFPEEAKKHLFDKFYQADTSHRQEGNGLGLALVKRILIREKGEVFAENPPGGGCRFTVALPLPEKKVASK